MSKKNHPNARTSSLSSRRMLLTDFRPGRRRRGDAFMAPEVYTLGPMQCWWLTWREGGSQSKNNAGVCLFFEKKNKKEKKICKNISNKKYGFDTADFYFLFTLPVKCNNIHPLTTSIVIAVYLHTVYIFYMKFIRYIIYVYGNSDFYTCFNYAFVLLIFFFLALVINKKNYR